MDQTFFTVGQIRPIDCAKEAFERVKRDYWLLFAISLIGAMLAGVTMYILIGAMICGIYKAYLKAIDGGRPQVDDLWAGMKFFRQSLPAAILIVVPIIIYFAITFSIIYLPIIMRAAMGSRFSDDEMLTTFGIGILVDMIVALIMIIIHSMLIFAFPLIVDRDLGSWDAIRLSVRAALKNMGGIGGLIAINFGIAIAGYLLFCVGLYLAIPLITGSQVLAYRRVFPRLDGDASPAVAI